MSAITIDSEGIAGPGGKLPVNPGDEAACKFLMMIEGECLGLGPGAAARKYGYSRQRYHQLRTLYKKEGLIALHSEKRGPKGATRRTDALVCEVIRHRFLDPKASAEVIAQKLRQSGWSISARSVQRTLSEYGLEKKLYQRPTPALTVETQRTRRIVCPEAADPLSLDGLHRAPASQPGPPAPRLRPLSGPSSGLGPA
jgi:transposase